MYAFTIDGAVSSVPVNGRQSFSSSYLEFFNGATKLVLLLTPFSMEARRF
jgi:hypothetical protein